MHITDTDPRFYQKKEFRKVLLQHEKQRKKDKYIRTCLEMRKDFTPMVYSVDGIMDVRPGMPRGGLPPT